MRHARVNLLTYAVRLGLWTQQQKRRILAKTQQKPESRS